MLYRWEEVVFLVCSVGFSPNKAVLIVTKSLYLGLICPENGLPEGLWFVQVLSGKVETGSFVLS